MNLVQRVRCRFLVGVILSLFSIASYSSPVTHKLYVHSDHPSVSSGCATATECSTVAAAFEEVANLCAADTAGRDSYEIFLALGELFRETEELTIPCDKVLLSSYDSTTMLERAPCFEQGNCPIVTRAKKILRSEWTRSGSSVIYTHIVSSPGLARASLINPDKLFVPGDRKSGPDDTARMPEVRRNFGYGYLDDDLFYLDNSSSADDECPTPPTAEFPDCGMQSLGPNQWGQQQIRSTPTERVGTRKIYLHDAAGRLNLESYDTNPFEISTARFVLRTSDPASGQTRKNVVIENLFMYGAAYTVKDQPVGPPFYKVTVSTVLHINNAQSVKVRNVRLDAGMLYTLSVVNGSNKVSVENSDITDASTWCIDVRGDTSRVGFSKVAAHHCGNNLGDTIDGHGFGSNNTDDIAITDSVFYANGYAGGVASRRDVSGNPTQKRVHAAVEFYNTGGIIKAYNNSVSCNWRSGLNVSANVLSVGENPQQSFANNRFEGNGRIALRQIGLPPEQREQSILFAMRVRSGCDNRGVEIIDNEFNWNLNQQDVFGRDREAALWLLNAPVPVPDPDGLCYFAGTTQDLSVLEINKLSGNKFCYSIDADFHGQTPPVGETLPDIPAFACDLTPLPTGSSNPPSGPITVLEAMGNVADTAATGCDNYDPSNSWSLDTAMCPPTWQATGYGVNDIQALENLGSCLELTSTDIEPWQ